MLKPIDALSIAMPSLRFQMNLDLTWERHMTWQNLRINSRPFACHMSMRDDSGAVLADDVDGLLDDEAPKQTLW